MKSGSTSKPVTSWRSATVRRALAAGTIGAMFLGAAACGSTAASSSSSSSSGSSSVAGTVAQAGSAPIKLKFWEFLNGPDSKSLTSIVDAFNKSQSNVQVIDTQLNFDAMQQKLLVSIASGSGPDLVTLGEDFLSQYVGKGAFAPLDDFYSSARYPNAKALIPSAVKGAEINGHPYGIPLNFYDELLCYNKDIFAKAGVNPPKTWDEFAATAPKLTVMNNGKPSQYAIALGDQTDTTRFWQPLLWNGGGGVVSDDGKKALLSDPKTLAALNFWVTQVKDKQVSPIGDQGPAAESLFNAGKAAMVPCGPWVVGTAQTAKINLGLAPMPSGSAGNFPWAGSLVFTVPKTASPQVKAAAYQFANFWNSKESQITFSAANGYPTTRTDVKPTDVTGNPFVSIFGAPAVVNNSKLYLAGLSTATQINNDVFTPALQKALAGQGSVDDLFTAANAKVQALLDGSK